MDRSYEDLCSNKAPHERSAAGLSNRRMEINAILRRRKHMTAFEISFIYFFVMSVLKSKPNKNTLLATWLTLTLKHHRK